MQSEELDSYVHSVNGFGQNAEWHVDQHGILGLSGADGNYESFIQGVTEQIHGHSWHSFLWVVIKCNPSNAWGKPIMSWSYTNML